MKQPVDQERRGKGTSQAKSKFTEDTHLGLIFSLKNWIKFMKSFLCLQNDIDWADSSNKCAKNVGKKIAGKFIANFE